VDKLVKVTKRDNGNVIIEVENTSLGTYQRIELNEKDVVTLKLGMDRTVRPGS
jgi:hypothetical protein